MRRLTPIAVGVAILAAGFQSIAAEPSNLGAASAVLPGAPGAAVTTASIPASALVPPLKPPTVEPLLRYSVDSLAETIRIAKNGTGKAEIAFGLLIKSGRYDRAIRFPDVGAVSLARLETTTGTVELEHRTTTTKEDGTIHSFRSPIGQIPSGAIFRVLFDGDLEKRGLVDNPAGEGGSPIEVQWRPMLYFHDAVISTYSLRLIYPLDYTGPESRKAPKAFDFERTVNGPAPSRQLFGSVDGRLAVTFMWPNLTSSQTLALTVAAKVRAIPPPPPKPVAAFEATPVRGEVPLTVQFRNLSKGPIARHAWDFGDQAQSTETEPTHRYAVPGSFTVTLTVSGPGGTDTKRAPAAIGVLMKERDRIAKEIWAILAPGVEKTIWKQMVESSGTKKIRCAQDLVARAKGQDKTILNLFLPLIIYDIEHNEDVEFKDQDYQRYRALLVYALADHDKKKAKQVFAALDRQAPPQPERWDLVTVYARRWLRSGKLEGTK